MLVRQWVLSFPIRLRILFAAHPQLLRPEQMGSDVRSNSNLASGLKSRPRNCPYTLVARRSGVRVIEGREFLNDKDAGRNASEPRCSLVNLMRLPTSCLNREGRSELKGARVDIFSAPVRE